MKYLELTLTMPHEAIELVTAELMDMGITATQVVDPAVVKQMMKKQHSYDWDYIDPALMQTDPDRQPELHLYFEDTEEGRSLRQNVKEHFPLYDTGSRLRDDKDWKFSYREHFRTHPLTNRILVKPTWEPDPQKPNMRMIELDPGMAFGTGDHETTSMCARLMEARGCSGKKVLDVGTGSGILSIAAALMGARTVLGIDIDPIAVEVAQSNVRQNQCEDRVEIRQEDFSQGIAFYGDLVVANLVAELVCQLAGEVRSHLCENGSYICSGILAEKRQMVRKALGQAGLTIVNEMEDGGWCAIEAINA